MDNVDETQRPGYFLSVVRHKCARCRTGDMFQTKRLYNLKQFMKMHTRCPVCQQYLELEPGFYYGTSYVSYSLTVALSVGTFLAWWAIVGLSLNDNRLFWWIGINTVILILSQPYLMRLSRSIWLSFFVKYNSNWKLEKPEDPERM
jgi:hypothetical protein